MVGYIVEHLGREDCDENWMELGKHGLFPFFWLKCWQVIGYTGGLEPELLLPHNVLIQEAM